MELKYKVDQPTYDISKSWEENYEQGPQFDGSYPPLPTEKKWKFLGFDLISPLGVAAGPLPNSKWILTYAKLGYASPTYKTVRSQAVKAHQNPNVVIVDVKGKVDIDVDKPLRLAKEIPTLDKISITNSFGNPCPEPKVWIRQVEKIKKELGDGQILPVSVYGTNKEGMSLEDLADDYAKAAKFAKEAGADAVEINLSCPNVLGDEDPNIFCSLTATSDITKTVKKYIGETPLILKVGYYPSYDNLTKVIKEIGGHFEAISAINTIPKKVYKDDGSWALPGRETSGICGAAIKEYGLETVRRLKKAKDQLDLKYEIIGVGGVMRPQDVLDYLEAGANHVHSATAVMWNPYLAYELYQFLEAREKIPTAPRYIRRGKKSVRIS